MGTFVIDNAAVSKAYQEGSKLSSAEIEKRIKAGLASDDDPFALLYGLVSRTIDFKPSAPLKS